MSKPLPPGIFDEEEVKLVESVKELVRHLQAIDGGGLLADARADLGKLAGKYLGANREDIWMRDSTLFPEDASLEDIKYCIVADDLYQWERMLEATFEHSGRRATQPPQVYQQIRMCRTRLARGGFRQRRIRAWTRGIQSAGHLAIRTSLTREGVRPPVETRHYPCPAGLRSKLRKILRCIWLRTGALPIPSETGPLFRRPFFRAVGGGDAGDTGNAVAGTGNRADQLRGSRCAPSRMRRTAPSSAARSLSGPAIATIRSLRKLTKCGIGWPSRPSARTRAGFSSLRSM